VIVVFCLQEKCDEYWPAVGKSVTHGHVTVTSTDEDERADFVIRSFTIKVKEVGMYNGLLQKTLSQLKSGVKLGKIILCVYDLRKF
jgi:hypothetical protein